jgi:hypothetical protein
MFHDVSATLLTEHAETTVRPIYQGNLNQALKDPKRKSNHKTRASAKPRQNKIETGKTKPRIIRSKRVHESSEAEAQLDCLLLEKDSPLPLFKSEKPSQKKEFLQNYIKTN